MNLVTKFVVVAGVCSMVAGGAVADLKLVWGSNNTANDLFDSTGSPYGAGPLRAEVVVDADGDTDVSAMLAAGQFGIGSESSYGGAYDTDAVSDDVVISVGAWVYDAGDFYCGQPFFLGGYTDFQELTISDGYATDKYYVRWFSTSDGAEGSEVGVMYDTTAWNLPPLLSPETETAALDFASKAGTTLGSVNGTAGWATVAAVPEPGLLGLLAVGVMTLVARRKRKA